MSHIEGNLKMNEPFQKQSVGRSKLPSLQQGESKKSQTSLNGGKVYSNYYNKKRSTLSNSTKRQREIRENLKGIPTNAMKIRKIKPRPAPSLKSKKVGRKPDLNPDLTSKNISNKRSSMGKLQKEKKTSKKFKEPKSNDPINLNTSDDGKFMNTNSSIGKVIQAPSVPLSINNSNLPLSLVKQNNGITSPAFGGTINTSEQKEEEKKEELIKIDENLSTHKTEIAKQKEVSQEDSLERSQTEKEDKSTEQDIDDHLPEVLDFEQPKIQKEETKKINEEAKKESLQKELFKKEESLKDIAEIKVPEEQNITLPVAEMKDEPLESPKDCLSQKVETPEIEETGTEKIVKIGTLGGISSKATQKLTSKAFTSKSNTIGESEYKINIGGSIGSHRHVLKSEKESIPELNTEQKKPNERVDSQVISEVGTLEKPSFDQTSHSDKEEEKNNPENKDQDSEEKSELIASNIKHSASSNDDQQQDDMNQKKELIDLQQKEFEKDQVRKDETQNQQKLDKDKQVLPEEDKKNEGEGERASSLDFNQYDDSSESSEEEPESDLNKDQDIIVGSGVISERQSKILSQKE